MNSQQQQITEWISRWNGEMLTAVNTQESCVDQDSYIGSSKCE
jgi:hypothetical protein